jgi:signal transduction histidine kinase
MRLRGQLLLAALIVALLPISAVLFLKPIEQLLRSGHEQAVAETATTAAALLADAAPPDHSRGSDEGVALYLHPATGRRLLDGYADDWTAWIDRVVGVEGRRSEVQAADRLEDGEDPVRLAALLDGRMLELYLRVRDGSPQFSDVAGSPGDTVRLEITDAEGLRRFELAPTAPGPLVLRDRFGRLLRGYWQDRSDGWSLELRALIAEPVRAVSVEVIDRAGDGRAPLRHATGPLAAVGRDREAQQRLERLAIGPAWWLDRDGWVRAHAAGAAALSPAEGREVAEAADRQGALDFLMAARMASMPAWSERSARLQSETLDAAQAGTSGAAWGRVGTERSIRVRYAVPVGDQGVLVVERDAGPLLLVANRAVLSWLGASLLLYTVLALLLFGFALLLALRIRRLRNTTEQAVSDAGRLERLPQASRARDELGDLSRGLHDLLLRLREHQRYLQSLADSLAHELRTPVSMVQSSLDNLENASEPERAVYLARAGQGARRLRRIVQAMSQASRLEESLESEPRRPMDLARLVRDYAAARSPALPRHRLRADVEDEVRAPIDGAEDLLAQLLDKIVDNAVDFTPEDGQITLRVAAFRDGWQLAVENEGVPIDPDRAAAAFDSMVSFRSTKSPDDDAPHLGLGLYVARCIVQFHGGRISARPTAAGSCFEVWLPAHRSVSED